MDQPDRPVIDSPKAQLALVQQESADVAVQVAEAKEAKKEIEITTNDDDTDEKPKEITVSKKLGRPYSILTLMKKKQTYIENIQEYHARRFEEKQKNKDTIKMMQEKGYDVEDYASSDDEDIQAEIKALKKNNKNLNEHND